MPTPSLSDLRYAYYGGGSAAEYAFLQAAQAQGTTALKSMPVIKTAAAMGAANPVLAIGQLGITSDTGVVKMGDGVTNWGNLYEFDKAGKVLGQVSINAHVAAGYAAIATIPGLSGLSVPSLPFSVEVQAYLPACHALVNTSSWALILYDGAGAAGTGVFHGGERVAPQNFTNQFAKNVFITKTLPPNTPKQFRIDALRTSGTGNLGMDLTADVAAYIRYLGV